jgi:hypothetical protein
MSNQFNQNLVDKLYYDITFSNLASDQTISPVVNFNETRAQPFLQDPEQYYMSIIRFSLDTSSLPIIIPTITPNQPDINLTTYSISLGYRPVGALNDLVVRTFIKFEPQNLIASLPSAPSQTSDKLQDNSTGYYYIYTYQFWIYLINKAFLECYTQLAFEMSLIGQTLPSPHPPVLEFDTVDRTAVINCDRVGYESNLPRPITIYFNNNLGQLFSSFPLYINSDSGDPLGLNYKIAISLFGGATLIEYPVIDPTYTAIQCWQEYSTTSIWSPVQSIVFTSSLLPVVSNQLSNPVILNNGGAIGSNGNNANFAQILTDMMVENSDYKPSVLYNPTAEYRLLEMIGNKPLYSVDIQIYWKNREGQLIAFRLVPGGTATMKLLFTKRKNLMLEDMGGSKFTH